LGAGFSRPSGTASSLWSGPGAEAPGYFRTPLRGSELLTSDLSVDFATRAPCLVEDLAQNQCSPVTATTSRLWHELMDGITRVTTES
jgi:hypothetical protein